MWSTLLEEGNTAGESTTKGKLALDQEQLGASSRGVLGKDRVKRLGENEFILYCKDQHNNLKNKMPQAYFDTDVKQVSCLSAALFMHQMNSPVLL